MEATILSIDTIVSNPQVRSGRPTIAGTGICVSDVVLAHQTGDHLTPEQLAENYRLSLGEVYAALSYYHLHRDAIDTEIRERSGDARHLIDELEAAGKLKKLE